MLNAPYHWATRAARHWEDNQALMAGHVIWENLPPGTRSAWAHHLLGTVVEHTGIRSSVIDRVLDSGPHPDAGVAVEALAEIDRTTEALESAQKAAGLAVGQDPVYLVLTLAGLVVKVQSSNGCEPGSAQRSGAIVALCIRSLTEALGDSAFANAAFEAMCRCPEPVGSASEPRGQVAVGSVDEGADPRSVL